LASRNTGCTVWPVRLFGAYLANSVPVPTLLRKGMIMSFGLYALGFLILIGGLIYGAHLMHVPPHWIAVGAIVLLGIGIVTGVQSTRQKDPA
jgi:hypothetical protein